MSIKVEPRTDSSKPPVTQQPTITPQVATISAPKGKTVGADVDPDRGEDKVMFLSYHKSTSYVRPDGTWLQFSKRHYETNDKEDILFLRKQPNFGVEIFEGEYPQWVTDRFRWERENISGVAEDDQYTGGRGL